MMSIAQWLGLPADFLTALLLIAFCLTLAPYIEGVTIGSWSIPKLLPGKKRIMKIVAPLVLAAFVAAGVPLQALRPGTSNLQLLAADFTERGVIDVAVSNSGTSAALLTRIELEVLHDHRQLIRPALDASATYRIPIDDALRGQRRAAVIRHLIPPASTERLLIAPETGRVLDVRVHILSADGAVLTRDVHLWPATRSRF
jgi:hypothetical protein